MKLHDMKKNQYYIIGGIALALAGGIFLWRKYINGKKAEAPVPQEPISDIDQSNSVVSTVVGSGTAITSTLGGLSQSIFGFLTEYNDYLVNTQTSGLNVRSKPDAKSKIVGNLKKGQTIKAKASGVKGWFDVSKDGKNNFGYVSSQFLKALPKKK